MISLQVTGEPVYVIPDPPHCLKNARNALKTHGIRFAPNKFARWQDFVKLVTLDGKSDLRIVPKLNMNHIDLILGRNMKVNIAAQTLSHSAAVGIRTYVRLGMMPAKSLDTAEFMERVNAMFDLGNGTSPNAPNSKASLTPLNFREKACQLQKCAEWVSKWRFFKDGKETHRHQFHSGWSIALCSMAALGKRLLFSDGFEHVPLRRLSQDHIEVSFRMLCLNDVKI